MKRSYIPNENKKSFTWGMLDEEIKYLNVLLKKTCEFFYCYAVMAQKVSIGLFYLNILCVDKLIRIMLLLIQFLFPTQD